jgi:ADP-ribose pyrophosphatase
VRHPGNGAPGGGTVTRGDGAWRRLASRLLLDRSPWLRVFADDVELPDGRRIEGYLRVDGRPYAAVFAVTEDQRAVFIRGYKYGPNRGCVQLPAGYLEEGEAPEAAARRELLEETGYQAQQWEDLGACYPDGNRGFGVAHFFLARAARAVQAPDSGDLEEVTVRTVPLAEIPALLASGEMVELSSVACVALALTRLGRLPGQAPGPAGAAPGRA